MQIDQVSPLQSCFLTLVISFLPFSCTLIAFTSPLSWSSTPPEWVVRPRVLPPVGYRTRFPTDQTMFPGCRSTSGSPSSVFRSDPRHPSSWLDPVPAWLPSVASFKNVTTPKKMVGPKNVVLSFLGLFFTNLLCPK